LLDLLEPWDVRALSIRKTADLPLQLRVGTFPRFCGYQIFIFYPKPLYKLLHQSFFYPRLQQVEQKAVGRLRNLGLNVRMLFPSFETGTAMNVRESENYLPISRSFSASK
jgi:hypothetical protein